MTSCSERSQEDLFLFRALFGYPALLGFKIVIKS
jgi:hypothetical protein